MDGATDFLRRAAAIMEQRAAQYDQPGGERNMGRTVEAFNAITGHKLTEADGWLLLQCLKDVRQWSAPGFHRDSAEDGVAYSALKAEALAAQQEDAPAALRFFGAVADRPRTAEEAACWCATCRPVTLQDCRMVLCPACGNKRCPRADDHRNVCGNSNAPGQVPVRETPP